MIRYYNENTKFDTFIDDVINSLFPEGAPHDALIEFDYVKELAGNTAGLCDGDTKHVEITLSENYSFECGDTAPYCDQELASNIAHELVHASQFIRGMMNNENYLWNGIDYQDCAYADQPWEIEAYSMEKVLVDVFWKQEEVA
jgi:hypothetical protein|tara:strand:+ start:2725 stop:3153 length:429 start_codon:yes stop_codon:yes gene_type:complete